MAPWSGPHGEPQQAPPCSEYQRPGPGGPGIAKPDGHPGQWRAFRSRIWICKHSSATWSPGYTKMKQNTVFQLQNTNWCLITSLGKCQVDATTPCSQTPSQLISMRQQSSTNLRHDRMEGAAAADSFCRRYLGKLAISMADFRASQVRD